MEFGEKLKNARERKGITQQTVAEQIFVTRQTVSRWENGSRYPDLLTLKKLSEILNIQVDELLSEEPPVQLAEKLPITEDSLGNRILLLLYAIISFSFLTELCDLVFRFAEIRQDLTNFYYCGQLTVFFLFTGIFSAGCVFCVQKSLAPKKQGILITLYFLTLFMRDWMMLFRGDQAKTTVMIIIGSILCLLSAYFSFSWFCKASAGEWQIVFLLISCLLLLVRSIYTGYTTVRYANDFLSLDTALHFMRNISIFILLTVQALLLKRKRKFTKS